MLNILNQNHYHNYQKTFKNEQQSAVMKTTACFQAAILIVLHSVCVIGGGGFFCRRSLGDAKPNKENDRWETY